MCFRHSEAVLHWQRHQNWNPSDEEGHCMVDGQAREIQEPRRQQQSHCRIPRWPFTTLCHLTFWLITMCYSNRFGFLRHEQPSELEEVSWRTWPVRSWEQWLHQRGLHCVDAHGCAAHIPQALSHYSEEVQYGPHPAQWQLWAEHHLQYPFRFNSSISGFSLVDTHTGGPASIPRCIS